MTTNPGQEFVLPPGPTEIVLRVEQLAPPAPHRWSLKAKLGCLVAGAAVLVGAYVAVDDRLNWPHFGWPDAPGGAEVLPPVLEAGVRHDTYLTEKTYDHNCESQVSVGNEVEGSQSFQVDLGLFTLTPGIGEVNKIKFGDFLLCGDTGSVRTNAVLERDRITNKVTRVIAYTDGLVPTHPRVAHTDSARNCAKLRVGDSKEKIDAEIAKWERQFNDWQNKKKGAKRPPCDDGFKVSRAGAPDSVAEIKDTANAAAQIAMTVAADPRQQIEAQNGAYLAKVDDMLRRDFPGVPVEVRLNGAGDQRQRRLEEARRDLEKNYYKVELPTPGSNVLKVTAPNGGEITVRLRTVDVQPLVITGTSKSEERVIPPPPSPVTPTTRLVTSGHQ